MEPDKLSEKYLSLPVEAQKQVEAFVNFLADQYRKKSVKNLKKQDLKSFKFVGMWAGRHEMSDSTEWVKNIRKKEWSGDSN